jgi:tetratricopeptide (TPR) repeat protein
MLVLEDAHWIDPLSDDLLEAVGRAIADLPLLLLVVYRTPESEATRPRVARLSHFSEIRLGEFSRIEAERLIGLKVTQLYQGKDRTGSAPGTTEPAAHVSPQAPPDLVKQIVARAQGNPFYIDEMLNLIHTRGIDLSDTDSAEALDLPDSLHSLIISRIDQLDEDVKATLKVASVIGRLFKASWLWGIYPQLGAPERVTAQLDQLNRQALIALDRPEPELEYLFRHIVTREVAYESLSVATRARLHQQIGRYIEQTYTETLEQYVDLLAYHYGLSPDRDKQREYFRRAGMAAQAAYANEAAIEYYRRLLPLLPDTERSEWMLRLGEIQQLTGEWAAAEATYIQALDSAGDLSARAGCQQALGRLQVGKGAYADALAWLEQARAGYRALGDEQNFAAALQQIGVVYWSQNAFHDALQCFEQYLSFVERTGDQRGLSVVTNNIGLVYWNLDQLDRALQSLERSLQIATALDDRMRTGIAVGNMGNIYQAQGDLEHALSCYARNLQIALDIGDRLGIGIAVGNMGSIYQVRGDYPYALACYARNLQIALDIGDRPGAGMSSWSIAESLVARGDYEQAGRFLAGAITIGQALESPYELSDYLLTEVDRLTRLGQYSYALRAAEEAQRRANEADRTEIAFRARLSQITLRATLGRVDRAAAQEAYQHLLAEGDEAQQADVLYAAWRLDPAHEEARRRAVELYRVRYAHASDAEVRRRLIELTGEHPPDPPALPAPPEIVTRDPAPLHGLLARIDALIAEPGGPPEESVAVGG